MLSITIHNDRVYIGERFSVSFQRTLRIPDDGRDYPLPPGLGGFPLHCVEDYSDRLPKHWQRHNSVFIPMYQREALWLGFDGTYWKPNAVKIAVGKINVVSGKPWDDKLHSDPQDYIVCPDQPWLDGINAGEGVIRQFVAAPLGLGYTVEAQISGKEEFGGIQIRAYEPKPGRFPDQPPPKHHQMSERLLAPLATPVVEMGLGVGGKVRQKIYPDPYGLDSWDLQNYGGVFVYLVNSTQYKGLTGLEPPPTVINAQTYTQYGLPWFELYDETRGDIAAPKNLTDIKSIKEMKEKTASQEEEESVYIDQSTIKKLRYGESNVEPYKLDKEEL